MQHCYGFVFYKEKFTLYEVKYRQMAAVINFNGHCVPVGHISFTLSTHTYSGVQKTMMPHPKVNCLGFFGLVDRLFANGPGDMGSIPGRIIPKTLKMVLDASLLNTQQYKVHIKGKLEQSV